MAHAAKPTTCAGCPAHTAGSSYVPGCGPPTAQVAIIGQGPGREEAEGHWSIERQEAIRAPFIGRSGLKLNAWLERVNSVRPELPRLRREDVWLDNTVRCWLVRGGKDREPTAAEIAFCTERHLRPALAALPQLRLVIPVGVPAIRGVLGEGAGQQWAGGTYKVNNWP